MLQPLAENAVRHGIAPSIAGGSVEVAAVREGEQLVLRVRDTGVGLTARLRVARAAWGCTTSAPGWQHLYPGQHRFRVANRAGGRRRVAAGDSFPWSGGGACLSQ